MIVFLVIFSLSVLGSLICLGAGFVLNLVARKTHSESLAMGAARESSAPTPRADPVLIFGFTLAFYGAIALALVTALPGAFALERTGLVFAFLCVGGLFCEMSTSRPSAHATSVEPDAKAPSPRKSVSWRLAVALTITLDLAFAVLSAQQGLIDIVPPKPSASHDQELDAIVVVAQRTHDPLDDRSSIF